MTDQTEHDPLLSTTTLLEFLQWSVKPGHYEIIKPLANNFCACKRSLKEREGEALRERVENE